MSSASFYVRIGAIQGDTVVFHCLTGFAGGVDDHATSRSFGLQLLLDASTDWIAGDLEGAPEAERERRLALAARASASRSILHAELTDPQPWDEDWNRRHVPHIVRATRLLARHNDLGAKRLAEILQDISALESRGMWAFLQAAWQRLHHFDLEVTVTDAKYLVHLVPGHEFDTTAYDAWRE